MDHLDHTERLTLSMTIDISFCLLVDMIINMQNLDMSGFRRETMVSFIGVVKYTIEL